MTNDLAEVTLSHGSHAERDDGMCLLELVAYLAAEEHTDRPRCVSRILGHAGRELNDTLPLDIRQQLKPLAEEMIGTADDGAEAARMWLALDWIVRTWLPAWLELVPELAADARKLRELPALAGQKSGRSIGRARKIAEEAATRADGLWLDTVLHGPGIGKFDAAEAVEASLSETGAFAENVCLRLTSAHLADTAMVTASYAARTAVRDAVEASPDMAPAAVAAGVIGPVVGRLRTSALDLFTRMVRAKAAEAATETEEAA